APICVNWRRPTNRRNSRGSPPPASMSSRRGTRSPTPPNSGAPPGGCRVTERSGANVSAARSGTGAAGVIRPSGPAVTRAGRARWAQAIEGRVRERLGLEVQTMYTDDGIVVRLPEADEAPPADSILFQPEEVEGLVVQEVGGSALFASRFRECAGRALLLPRR